MLLECFYCFIVSVGFSIVFNIRGWDILFGGLGSGIGWGIYLLFFHQIGSEVIGYLLATIIITYYSEVMARFRKKPSTMFLIPSIIPMVPGGAVFRAMSAWLSGREELFLAKTRYALTVAGAIAMGIILGTTIHRLRGGIIRLSREIKQKKGLLKKYGE